MQVNPSCRLSHDCGRDLSSKSVSKRTGNGQSASNLVHAPQMLHRSPEQGRALLTLPHNDFVLQALRDTVTTRSAPERCLSEPPRPRGATYGAA